MYNTKFECRYHKDDIFLESDNVSENEKSFVRDILYKEDIVNIFLIDTGKFDDDEIAKELEELYNKIKHEKAFKDCMRNLASLLFSEDEMTGLILMYSYDHMFITHQCISEYLETGKINFELLAHFTTN